MCCSLFSCNILRLGNVGTWNTIGYACNVARANIGRERQTIEIKCLPGIKFGLHCQLRRRSKFVSKHRHDDKGFVEIIITIVPCVLRRTDNADSEFTIQGHSIHI